MRKIDIKELLEEVDENIKAIVSENTRIQNDYTVTDLFKVKVKSTLENLRSCLDYSANDIYETLYSNVANNTKKKIKVYFPYGKNTNDFNSELGKVFKKLDTINNDMYILIKSIQPFESKLNWIVDLCKITNIIKHDELVKHKRINSEVFNMGGQDIMNFEQGVENMMGTLIFEGCTFNGVKQKSDIKISNGIIKTGFQENEMILIKNSMFMFKDTDISVINLLESSYNNIKVLIDDIYHILESL